MRLLIDGYNLLHATDLFGAGELAGTLRGSRQALVDFLVDRLSPAERRDTLIVFDAADAPLGLPDRATQDDLDIRFARGYPDADAMIEHLLESGRPHRGLTVVSGDRRVQRAARSAGAEWVDSHEWFTAVRHRPAGSPDRVADRPTADAGSQAEWIAEFSDPAALAEARRQAANDPLPPPRPSAPPPSPEPPSAPPERRPPRRKKRRPPMDDAPVKPEQPFGEGLFDPFPPGYGEDLLRRDPRGRGEQ
ncbi:NYN domain-containing protein [Botrimarina sp.]|uniref:NYN domain-containing protein n=1 Tax=Botrimarina sp. TaxID=2795802 RepID=UPI0032F01E43